MTGSVVADRTIAAMDPDVARTAAATRIERDSMGEMEVPADALYGASTQRAVLNFPISGQPLPAAFLRALGLIKQAAAETNARSRPARSGDRRSDRCRRGGDRRGPSPRPVPDRHLPDRSGTSTNTNMNEVIASLASTRLAAAGRTTRSIPTTTSIGASRRTTSIPTALQLSAAIAHRRDLVPALERLASGAGGEGG